MERYGMKLTIGGLIDSADYEELRELLRKVIDDVETDDIQDAVFIEGRIAVDNCFQGMAPYGDCDEIKDFCQEKKLSFLHINFDPDDMTSNYWNAETLEKHACQCTGNGEMVVLSRKVEPVIEFMRDTIKEKNMNLNVTEFEEKLKRKLKDILPPKLPDIPKLVVLEHGKTLWCQGKRRF